jgi:4-hydroxyphenylacetate 3-monooxygenase/anthranilate 3-monooxygenase (FAD)/4-hydroxyphenylacetate 3-monooxygenase
MGIRNGAQYTAGLRDGRAVWQGGRRIDDVTTHPGFAGTVRTLAALYDEQHDPAFADVMTTVSDGERISYSYLAPATLDELLAKRRNIEHWSVSTMGLMGRFPDFCSELIVGLLDFADVLGRANPQWGANARAYYRHCTQGDVCLTHALTDQYYDRTRPASAQDDPDLFLHVVGETPAGPIVRGLRTLATLAPLADEVIVYPNAPRQADEPDYALAFAIPMNAPGLKILCRDLYAEHAPPDRLPLTARFDEIDAALLFDDVVVPWERIFVYRDPKLCAAFHGGIRNWATYSTLLRLIVRLETFLGVTQILSRWAKRDQNPQTQGLLGTMVADIQILRGCVRAAEADPFRTPGGFLAPSLQSAYRLFGIEASDRAERIVADALTSTLMVTGGLSDLDDAEIGPLVERWFRGGAETTAEHLKVMAVAADLVMSPFGARSRLYERLQSGEPPMIRRRLYNDFKDGSAVERVRRFVEKMEVKEPL